ncbi:hypothetical protein SAMN05216317_1086 [Nitrosomonas eutropha]|nr:hypothetical protein SAMN05216379_1146 [Nitrosomonas eutropha]SDW58105.1 hypothetical protein SAMN05216317_1086 [Nitrosomonas eutropha]
MSWYMNQVSGPLEKGLDTQDIKSCRDTYWF